MKKKQELAKQEVRHLARLSKLQLTDNELEKIGSQLNATIDYVHNLAELDTTHVSSETHVTKTANVWREDKIDTSQMFTQTQALKNAKNKKNGYFVVKRII